MRSIWKGAISFGLVNIPVHMYTASHEHGLSFTLLHKSDFSTVRYAKICKAEEKEIAWDEIVKGYEYKKGDFVILKDEDFEKVNMKKTKTIEIVNFIAEAELDPIYYVKPYYLEPEESAVKAYVLLREALKKAKKVGLAKYVLRNREHLAVVRNYGPALLLNELRYDSELAAVEELRLPSGIKADAREVEIAIQLIGQLTVPFKPEAYRDTYIDELKEMIDKKSKGRPIHPQRERAEPPTKVHDLMALLQASLESKKPPKAPRMRKAG